MAGTSVSASQGTTQSQGAQQSTSTSRSSTYIPEYSQTPILNEIAQYSRNMAPQVYQWGMEQYGKNQGNIDSMMRNALSYASPQRIAAEMGRAEAGVAQGADTGRQNAIRDLQSYGIDPSSGRYAALDKANQVMAGAAIAGAGNQQREATTTAGAQMAKDAMGLSEQNNQIGYGASGAMNALLGTGMSLKYSPLGNTSSTDAQSSGYNTSSGQNTSTSTSISTDPVGGGGVGGWGRTMTRGAPGLQAAEGGYIDDQNSPTGGAAVDDVPANLTAGEFVIPKDVAEWKGQEFFYKLMAQARKLRATAGTESDGMGYQDDSSQNGQDPNGQEPTEPVGYAGGGFVNVLSPGTLDDQRIPWWRTMTGGGSGRST